MKPQPGGNLASALKRLLAEMSGGLRSLAGQLGLISGLTPEQKAKIEAMDREYLESTGSQSKDEPGSPR